MKTIKPKTTNRRADEEARWAALLARTTCSDDAFVYGVRTTHVFCRPSCRSRVPNRENVLFFNSPAAALAAGFRACKRCQPAGPGPESEACATLTRACRLLEQAEGDLPLTTLAKSVGVSPFHFHRLFKSHLGVTPKQYQAARRMSRFKNELQRGGSVTSAVYNAGFRSSGRAYHRVSARLGMSPRQFQKGGPGHTITYGIAPTPLGLVLAAATAKGVCAVELGSSAADLRRELKADFPRAALREDRTVLANALRQLTRYLTSPRRGVSLPLDIRGTAFQRQVWAALQRVTPGTTVTYKELAQKIGAPKAIRAVGSACAANKIALAIPCHRAVRSDGSLGGYRWGLSRKRALLEAEKRC